MLELVISPSLTVNRDRPGKAKLNRADTDVWTLSDVEGRPPGVSVGGPVAVALAPRNLVKGPTAFDACPFSSTVIMTISPLAVGIVASGPELWRALLTVLSCLVIRGASVLVRVPNFLCQEMLTPPGTIGSFGCVPGPGPGCVPQGQGSSSESVPQHRPAITHPGGRFVYKGLTLGQELICLLLSGWVRVKEAEES